MCLLVIGCFSCNSNKSKNSGTIEIGDPPSDHSYANTFEEAMKHPKDVTYISVFARPNTIVPEDINTLANLEELHLFDSDISEIPIAIGGLKKLKILTILKDPIESLPKEIGNLISLEKLYVSGCRLKDIPDEVTNLKNLEQLWIGGENGGNSISALPEEIGKLENLTSLNLYGNPISELPESLKMCHKLKYLCLWETEITKNEYLKWVEIFPDANIEWE